MDQGSNLLYSSSPMGSTSGSTWDVTTGSTSIDEQVEIWAASRANFGLNCDQNMDPKKARRLMLKRLESKRYRLRKKMHLTNLEAKAKETQAQIAYDLQPQIESELDQKSSLLLEQEILIHQINNLQKELLLKSAFTNELLAELNMWNELYTMQQDQQQVEMLNSDGYNMHSISYESYNSNNNISNPHDQDKHETNVNDFPNNTGLMKMIPTPGFNNRFP